MLRNRPRQPNRLRIGATAVEFAIVAPMFFIMVIASLEFGRMNIIRHTADQAAYEAARHAMVPGATAAEARSRAQRMLRVVGTRGATVTITPAVIDSDTQEISVMVDIPLNQNGWISPRFAKDATIHAESSLKTERALD